MTAKAALCKHLLAGETLNIKNCFTMIGLTNCPREISRMIEKPFGVIISRKRMEGHSRYGQPVSWVDYRLNPLIEGNSEGIKKMVAYLMEQGAVEKTGAKIERPITDTNLLKKDVVVSGKIIKQCELFPE
jgi:hypothetical protein